MGYLELYSKHRSNQDKVPSYIVEGSKGPLTDKQVIKKWAK